MYTYIYIERERDVHRERDIDKPGGEPRQEATLGGARGGLAGRQEGEVGGGLRCNIRSLPQERVEKQLAFALASVASLSKGQKRGASIAS